MYTPKSKTLSYERRQFSDLVIIERLITTASNCNNRNNLGTNRKATIRNLETKMEEKQLNVYFKWQNKEIAHEMNWT